MDKSLKNREWKEFKITEIFSRFQRGKRQKSEDREAGNVPYYSASIGNNGLTDFISNPSFVFKNNAIIYSTFGDAYFAPSNFSTSDEITILYSAKLNKYNSLFIVQALQQNHSKYCFGRKAFSNKIIKDKIMLPINSKGEPDYKFMEEYIKEREYKFIEQYKCYIKFRIRTLDDAIKIKPEWKEFSLSEIFVYIQRGKRLIKENQKTGKIPYVSSTSLNNGVDNFIENTNDVRIYGNCLSLANSGSVGSCFYQPSKFVASDHITHLKGNFSKYAYLFMACMLNRLSEKYNFNREINDTRIKREKIFLPVNSKGEPDYKYMEDYMKYLEQKKLLEYIEYIG